MTRLAIVSFLFILVACSDDDEKDSGAVVDAVVDAGTRDASGTPDGTGTDAGHPDAVTGECPEVDGGTGPGLIIVEAEAFTVNEYWAKCPSNECESDQSDSASGRAHLATYENHTTSGPAGWIRETVNVATPGSYTLWVRSARAGQNRGWGVAIDGTALFGTFGEQTGWESAGAVTLNASVEIALFDLAPDGYWAYPDALIFADDAQFDPNNCPGGGAQATDCLPGNHAPVITLRANDATDPGVEYRFAATVSDPDGDPFQLTWTQISGPTVTLNDATTARPMFETPSASTETELTFTLVAEDGRGGSTSDQITITVIPRVDQQSAVTGCKDVTLPSGMSCQEVSTCGYLTQGSTYYLVTQDLTTSSTCLVVTDDVIVDLNGHTLMFDQGFDGVDGQSRALDMENGGFESSAVDATSAAGWDLSNASGARVVSTWEMPLVGDRALFVPANGEIVSSWVYLPEADRSYRGQIVSRGPRQPVNIVVERQTATGEETVCSRGVTDPLGGGKAVFCNFHGQPAGYFRVRVSSPRDQYYDDADVVPARSAGIGAVRYYSAYDGRPEHVCNLDDGYCHLPDESGGPTVNGGLVGVRNGTIRGSRSMRSFGVYVSGADLIMRGVVIEALGIAAQTVNAGNVKLFHNELSADMPWVIDRENISETSLSVGGGIIAYNELVGGQGVISASGSDGLVVRDNNIINRATVTNHYAISLGGAERALIEDNRFNCEEGDPTCIPFSGSGILLFRTRNSEIRRNHFFMVSARCDAEYLDAEFSTNAIRMTDYNAAVGAANGVFGNVVSDNTFDLRSVAYPQMPNCLPLANGIFYSVGAGDNFIERNAFHSMAESEDSGAYAFYIGGANNGGVWRNNAVEANDKVAWYASRYGAASNARFIENVFTRQNNAFYTPAEPDAAIRLGYCCGNEADDLVLLQNNFSSGFVPESFWFTSNQAAPYSYHLQWYVDVTVHVQTGRPVCGALVELAGTGETVRGYTNAEGKVRLVATERSVSGTNHRQNTTRTVSEETPHTLTVTALGYPTHTEQLTVDGAKSVDVQF